MCVYVRERERKCVCVCEREREKEKTNEKREEGVESSRLPFAPKLLKFSAPQRLNSKAQLLLH